jgi:hypothetical protein
MSKWTYKTGKVKGGFGETDFNKKTITIDKAKHKRGSKTPNPDGSENKLVTMAHELMHKAHPDWSEKKVESKARKMRETLSKKAKQRIYAKFS